MIISNLNHITVVSQEAEFVSGATGYGPTKPKGPKVITTGIIVSASGEGYGKGSKVYLDGAAVATPDMAYGYFTSAVEVPIGVVGKKDELNKLKFVPFYP